MNTDEKLGGILRAEAEQVRPGPEGWDRIREGIAARRRRTAWLRAGMAATTAAAVVATVVVVSVNRGPGRDGDVTTDPTPTATASPSVDPGSFEPVDAVWPFMSGVAVHNWKIDHDDQTWLEQPQTAAEEFARVYLGIPNATVEALDGDARYAILRTVEGTEQQILVTAVVMAQAGGTGGPWVVRRADSDAVSLDQPDALVSPMTVRGTYRSVDPHFVVELRGEPDAAGRAPVIAKAVATTGPTGWEATLTFTRTPVTGGSLLITEAGLADVGISSAAAVPVRFAADSFRPPPPPPDTFVGVESGRIAVYRTRDGARLRYLTEQQPGGGISGARVTDDGTTVVYAEGAGTCASGVRSVPIGGGAPRTLATVEGAATYPYYEPDTGFLSYVLDRCDAGTPSVVVREGESARPREVQLDARPRSAVQLTSQYVAYAGDDGKLHVDPLHSGVNGLAYDVAGCTWTAVAWNGRTGTFVAARVCRTGATQVSELVKVSADLGSQNTIKTLDAVAVQALDVDRSGFHVLIWRGGASVTGPIERLTPDETVVGVTQGPESPSW